MGVGTTWFKREIGKNTGKFVSNKLFGDKWSTPHKVIIAKENAKIEKQNSQELIKTEFKKLEIETKKTEIQQKGSLNDKKEFILTKTFSNDKEEIFDFGNYLITEIKSIGWSDKDEDTHLNSFSDVCLNKLSQCKTKLDSLGNDLESEYFEKEIKSLKNKKLFQKHYKHAGMVVLVIVFFICYKLGLIK
jgi:hypothetical protein